jgi:hypothetical protein
MLFFSLIFGEKDLLPEVGSVRFLEFRRKEKKKEQKRVPRPSPPSSATRRPHVHLRAPAPRAGL